MPASLEFHEYLWDTPVREIEGRENLGFLLAASGSIGNPVFHAHYADGLVESIDPPAGFPRPEPDPADRTTRVVIPPSLRTRSANVLQKQGSRYSGLMRRAVQCLNSRGLESPFAYGWPKTHGILEFPYPRQQGSTAGEESARFAQRRHWIIEVSSAGVYAAPVQFGLQCMTCASNLGAYKNGADVDLAWAYVNNNAAGKVLRVMDAGTIAPAYAHGSPWYTGMGWAFSWSGRSASNVVHRTVFDGEAAGQPDYYETRLNDLAFSVAFEGAAPLTLTQVAGTATALMPGHGFATGELASISGAAIDAYNGAHLVTVLDAGSFTFAIAPATPSPAGGTPMIANANGTATISAALTIGSAGRVTFRRNDLGTLWVPGSAAITQWDGIHPFSNFLNVSGPVHVFYDGEEKITTTWSASSTSVPQDQQLSPTPPPYVVNPAAANGLWDGVSFGFHYWGETYFEGPIAQMTEAHGAPDHPCHWQGALTVFGSGHNYPPYTSVSWGFSGPFNLAAEGYSRTRTESSTALESLFRHPGAGWSNIGGYFPCGSSMPCSATLIWEQWSRYILKTRAASTQSKSGTSALVLFPTEREAVAGVRRARETNSTSTTYARGELRDAQWRQVGHANTPGCPFTQFTLERVGTFFPAAGAPAPTSASTETSAMSYHLRASGGISVSASAVSGAAPALDPFVLWQAGVKETAESPLFLMRGGLEYPDAGLTPGATNQVANHVQRVEAYSLGGGFAALAAGRDPVAFIGQV